MLLQAPALFTWRWSGHSVPCLLHAHYCRQNPVVPNGNVSLTVTLVPSWRGRRRRMTVLASKIRSDDGDDTERRRKVVEHICLLKAKGGLSEEDEKDMLDFLYTSQYQMRGIVAVSLGRISNDNEENYTHAIYMRFQRKEDVAKFYENPFYLRILKEHVMPYCQGLVNADYESEVEDDLLSIFRKGEEFNYGVEFLHLIAFDESAFGATAEDALASLEKLTKQSPSLVVQSTQGSNFNLSSREYTHAVMMRFRSMEAFELFIGSKEYKDPSAKLGVGSYYFPSFGLPIQLHESSTRGPIIFQMQIGGTISQVIVDEEIRQAQPETSETQVWRSKFELNVRKTFPIHFSVDPVGEEIM